MFGIGPQELILILVIALIVVGPRKLPEMARSIGKGLREVRKAQDEVRKTIQVNLDDDDAAAPRATGARMPPPDADDAVADVGEPSGSGSDIAPASAAAASVGEVSRTLGRGLAELRKAREEIQRTFRVDLGDTAGASSSRPPRTARPPAGETAGTPPADAQAAEEPQPAGGPASTGEPRPGSEGSPAE